MLLPTGTTLNETNFVTALRARRVFAAEDKNGQLVLTANGNLMGGTYNNSGALTLNALHASINGQTVQRVQFFEGVPGRNGTVTQLAAAATPSRRRPARTSTTHWSPRPTATASGARRCGSTRALVVVTPRCQLLRPALAEPAARSR